MLMLHEAKIRDNSHTSLLVCPVVRALQESLRFREVLLAIFDMTYRPQRGAIVELDCSSMSAIMVASLPHVLAMSIV